MKFKKEAFNENPFINNLLSIYVTIILSNLQKPKASIAR